MIDIKDLEKRLCIVSEYCKSTNKKFYLLLSSSVENRFDPYFGGIRCTADFVAMSIINLSQGSLIEFGSLIESYVNMIFVDTEKKHPFEQISSDFEDDTFFYYSNLLSQAHETFNKCQIVPWSPSRLTSEAAISTIRLNFNNDISGKSISLIGPGSIGFKIALGLVEEGATVYIYSRDLSKSSCLVSAINIVKSRYTIASAVQCCSLESCLTISECLVLATSQDNLIDASHIFLLPRKGCFVLDVGKYSLTAEASRSLRRLKNLEFQRLDISMHLVNMIRNKHYLTSDSGTFGPKCCTSADNPYVSFVSGGYPGSEGDIVVDDAESPTFRLGLIDGDGSIIPDFSLIS